MHKPKKKETLAKNYNNWFYSAFVCLSVSYKKTRAIGSYTFVTYNKHTTSWLLLLSLPRLGNSTIGLSPLSVWVGSGLGGDKLLPGPFLRCQPMVLFVCLLRGCVSQCLETPQPQQAFGQ